MNLAIPDYVKKTLVMLEDNGYSAYVVGGAVRDFFLGLEPKDFDVTTNATPEQLFALAKKYNYKVIENLGHNFGVVMLVVNGQALEIGTFRGEVYGEDAHRPEQVVFCQNIKEDLSRRDFTINAMAVDKNGNLVDPYNGLVDLKNKVLKTVGDAERRFAEDGLRMFRACRFCSRYAFIPDEKLFLAIKNQLPRVRGLSMERVRTELENILVSSYINTGLNMLITSGLAKESCQIKLSGKVKSIDILPELEEVFKSKIIDWQQVNNIFVLVPKDLTLRWAMLLYIIFVVKAKDFAVTDILKRFNYNERFVRRINWLVENLDDFIGLKRNKSVIVKEWLRKQAQSKVFTKNSELVEAIEQLVELSCVMMIKVNTKEYDSIIKFVEKLPVHTSDLAITGKEVGEILLGEKSLGDCMKYLLLKVQEGEVENVFSQLQSAIKNYKNMIKD